jgi:tetratricopeptide (TPR) repeat protein
MKSKVQHETLALPVSGQIIGVVFRAMQIPYPDYLSKEMQRYFRGEGINDDTRREILYLLADQLVERGIIPNTPILDRVFLCPWAFKHQIARAISEYAAKWDSLREKTSYLPLSRRGKTEILVSCLRLATIDLAVRVAAYRHLAKLPAVEVGIPLWAQYDGNKQFLKQLKDLYGQSNLINKDLADATGVVNEKTVPGWLYRGCRPERDHLSGIAHLFASSDKSANEEELLQRMNRHYSLSDLCRRLTDRISRGRVDELIVALFHLSANLQSSFEQTDSKPVEDNIPDYLLGIIQGASSTVMRLSIRRLWETESVLEWKHDIVSVERDWVERLIQKHLRTDQSTLSRTHGFSYVFMANQPKEISASLAYQSAKYENNRIDGELRLWGGAGNEAYDWSEKTGRQLREAVARHPEVGRCHLRLGVFLGMNGLIPTEAEEGLQECLKAAELMPGWDLPRIEIAHIFMRTGEYNLALQHLEAVSEELGRISAKLAYTLGFARMMTGNMAGALSMFQRVIAAKPDHAPALDNAAYCAFKVNDTLTGRDYAKRARLQGISMTYDMYDVGKTKGRAVPFPFPILCETVQCRDTTCEGRAEAKKGREEWEKWMDRRG